MSLRTLVPVLALCVLATGCPKQKPTGNPDGGTTNPFADLTVSASPKIPGLTAKVEVMRDEQGIAHIFCMTDLDCIRAQGYVMAHDRLFEMDFYRHYAEGRLGEMLGTLPGVRDQDRFQARLLTTQDGTNVVDDMANGLDDTNRAFLQAFSDGVNAYMDDLTASKAWTEASPEYGSAFFSGDLPPKPWTPADSLAIGRLFSWQLSGTFFDELNRAALMAKLSPQMYADMDLSKPIDPTFVLPGFFTTAAPPPFRVAPSVRARMSKWAPVIAPLAERLSAMTKLREAFGPEPGSNDWVVDAAHSTTGHPLVANDPHLALYTPSLWWTAHLDAVSLPGATGTLEAKGNVFAGVPGFLIGTTNHIGWGVTTVGYDVTDAYLETVTGVNKVSFNGSDVNVIKATVKMPTGMGPNDYDTEKVCVVPEHGPIFQVQGMSDADLADPTKPCVDPAVGTMAVSMRWTGQAPSDELGAFRGLLYAKNVADAKAAIANFQVGAQNFVVGDNAGHILYDPHAKVPIVDGDLTQHPPFLPLPGDGTAEWKSYIPDADLPQATDPTKGWIVTANNDLVGTTADNDPINDKYYLYYTDAVGIRAGRITKLLTDTISQNGKVSPDDMKRIQNDSYFQLAALITPYLTAAADDDPTDVQSLGLTDAVNRLKAWDYETPTGLSGNDPAASAPVTDTKVLNESIATSIFSAWLYHAMDRTMADELKTAGVISGNQVSTGSQSIKAFYFILAENKDTYFDDVSTPNVTETRDQVLLQALKDGLDDLTSALGADPTNWLWGRVHVTDLPSALGLLGAPTDPYALPSVANNGADFTVDVAGFGRMSADGKMHNGHGPSMRIVTDVDPAGVSSWQILPGGEIDLTGNPNRSDQLDPYLAGQYLKVPFDVASVLSAAKARAAAGTTPGARWELTP